MKLLSLEELDCGTPAFVFFPRTRGEYWRRHIDLINNFFECDKELCLVVTAPLEDSPDLERCVPSFAGVFPLSRDRSAEEKGRRISRLGKLKSIIHNMAESALLVGVNSFDFYDAFVDDHTCKARKWDVLDEGLAMLNFRLVPRLTGRLLLEENLLDDIAFYYEKSGLDVVFVKKIFTLGSNPSDSNKIADCWNAMLAGGDCL